MRRIPFSIMTGVCISLLIIFMLFSLITGAVSLSWSQLLAVLLGNRTAENELAFSIVYDLRLPRTFLCVMVGAILGLCGAALQGLFRNPLADPGIIGVSAGSSLGAAIAIVLFPASLLTSLFPAGADLAWLSMSNSAIFAFVGGLLTTLLVFRIGQTPFGANVAIMLLSGVAIGALAFAALGFLQFIATDSQLRDVTMWQLGSLSGANHYSLLLCFFALLVMLVVLLKQADGLNALLLGESEARHLGIEVEVLKRKLVVACALGVGLSVAVAGMIGFIGLIVPHICRALMGPNHKTLLPVSALMGAMILLLADIFARQIAAPAEVPIGIVTALLGAPFFLVLLIRSKKRGNL